MTVFSVVPDPKNPVAYTIRTQEGTYYDIAIAGRISKEALESCAAYLTSHRYNGLSKIHALIEKNETGEAIVLSMQARVDNAFSKAVFAQVRSFPSPQILDPKSKRQLAYDLISGNAGDLACSESLLKEISWEPEDDLLRLARLYSTPHLSPWGKALIRYAANEIGLNPTHVLSEGQENAPEATLAEEVMRLIDFSHFSSLISKHAAPYPGLVDALAKLWAETQDPRYLKHLCDTDSPALVREFLSKFPDHPSLFEGIDISEFYYLWNSTHYMEFAELFLAAG
ncbi:MAG: hypothetical protein JSS61_05565, partial [Verrucomicrobia bacterium]|nr:hypothetical protein [Verrucomicrobiota bacterium]